MPSHLQLQQALVLRRASLRPRSDRPGRAERRGQLRKPRSGRRALPGGRAGRDEGCKAREGAEDGRPHGALPVAERALQHGTIAAARRATAAEGPFFDAFRLGPALGALRGSCRGPTDRLLVAPIETPIENKRARPARNGTADRGNAHAAARAATCKRLGTETAFEVLARADGCSARARPSSTSASASPTSRRRSTSSRPPSRRCATAITATRRRRASCRCARRWRRTCKRRHGVEVHPDTIVIMAGRQAHHVLLDPDVRPAGRRDHVSRPRLSHLPLDDPVHRRQAGADRAERGERVRLHRRPGAVADHAQDQPDHPQQPRQPLRRRRAGRGGRSGWSRASRSTPTSPSCRTRSTARCSTAAASTRASCAIPRSATA